MKKLIALMVSLTFVVALVGCASDTAGKQQEELETENLSNRTTIEIMGNSVQEIGRGEWKAAVEVSEEDAVKLGEIFDGGQWNTEVTGDGGKDCVVNLSGNRTYYHSESGVCYRYDLSDITYFSHSEQEMGVEQLVLTESQRETVNEILRNYITIG